MKSQIVQPCTLESEMGNCVWNWSYKHNAYMCSICGKEFVRTYTLEKMDEVVESEKKARNDLEILEQIEGEIRASFDGWDGAIKNGKQPVAIQDLDFWSNQLKEVIHGEVSV